MYWHAGSVFCERDRARARDRIKVLLQLRESQELKGCHKWALICMGKNQKIRSKTSRNIIRQLGESGFEQFMVFLSSLTRFTLTWVNKSKCWILACIQLPPSSLANYLLSVHFVDCLNGNWPNFSAPVLLIKCSRGRKHSALLSHMDYYPSLGFVGMGFFPAQRLRSPVLSGCWAWMERMR